MKKKLPKAGKPAPNATPDKKGKAAARVRCQHPPAPAYTRWAAFEAQVLSKVKNPAACMEVIAKRQAQVDDDSNEGDLVAAHIREKLRENRQSPDRCCVFFTTAEITKWLQDATGTKLPINKTTPYLRALAIPELRYSKKNGVPGWVWRGQEGVRGATARAFSALHTDPDDD